MKPKVKLFIYPKGGGKTSELITMCSKDPRGYIVCHNQREAARIFRYAKRVGQKIAYPLTYEEFIEGKFYALGINGFYIDNLELLLDKLGRGVPIKAATLSEESVVVNAYEVGEVDCGNED